VCFVLRLQFFFDNLFLFFLFEGDALGELAGSGRGGVCKFVESFVVDDGIAFAFLSLFREGEFFVNGQ